ncbi:MAG: hypothetical protein PHS66_03850 [Candidatus Omnitrophica bacterium]|nr:hypothetical protein [Candidatus Omnitrophota bacterium]
MVKKESRATKQDVLKRIEGILRRDINMEVKLVFAKIEKFLEPIDKKAEGFPGAGIGYVHIDEKLQAEYMAWEKSIKQEWFEVIEGIRESLRSG